MALSKSNHYHIPFEQVLASPFAGGEGTNLPITVFGRILLDVLTVNIMLISLSTSEEVLLAIKCDALKLSKVLRTICHWRGDTFPETTIASVALNNFAFAQNTECSDYRKEDAILQMRECMTTIKALAEYHSDDSTMVWVEKQLNLIIGTHTWNY